MKMDFLQFFKTKRVFITLGLLATTFLVSEFSLQTSGKLNTLSNLKEGVNTCFQRVSQTYTAKMIADSGSGYLTKAFMSSTEECFGDAISMMEEKFEYALAGTFKIANTISSDVHWFHEKLTTETAEKLVGSDVVVTNFGARFSSIENSRFKVMEGIGNLNSSLGSKVNYLRFGFWSLLAATIAFMCFEILSKKQAEVMAEYYEEQAKELNNQFNPLSINKVEELISASLENSKLPHLDMLIRHVGLQGREERITERKEYIAPRSFNTGSKQQNIEQEIENAWEMGDVATDDKVRTSELNKQYENIYADKLDIVHLDNVLAKVVSLTSSRLFTRGIVLEFDIDEELYVYAEEESLEQVFYHVFTNAFKDLENKPGMKKIKVNVRSLGGSLLISFEDNGLSFSNEFMKQESGLLGLEGKAITVSTELEICRMFMNEFGGSVLFENAFDADNNPVGKKVKLVFKTARKPTDNVVDRDLGENVEAGLSMVRKTTKKDFRAELENKLS